MPAEGAGPSRWTDSDKTLTTRIVTAAASLCYFTTSLARFVGLQGLPGVLATHPFFQRRCPRLDRASIASPTDGVYAGFYRFANDFASCRSRATPAAWACLRNHSSTSSSGSTCDAALARRCFQDGASRRRSHTLASSLALLLTPFPGHRLSPDIRRGRSPRHVCTTTTTRPRTSMPIVTYPSSAHLACADRIASEHVAEALQVRGE